MKFFYDTEFLENGATIELISIGIVRDDGETYYAVNSDMPVDRIKKNDWLMANVWPQLPLRGRKESNGYQGSEYPGNLDERSVLVKPKWVICNEVREFLLSADEPELWAWYAAYDHVALCQLFGRMIDLPTGIPSFTHDLKQIVSMADATGLPEQEVGAHNALQDALHLKRMFQHVFMAGLI